MPPKTLFTDAIASESRLRMERQHAEHKPHPSGRGSLYSLASQIAGIERAKMK
jgi:hypothetical protein